MYEIRDLKPSQLLLDSKNPRLERIEDRQLEALHELWKDTRKMLGLARHISEKGLDPTARLAAVKATSGAQEYVVLEGNRRLAALKALTSPAAVADILTPAQKAKLDSYSTAYHQTPVVTAPCAVFASRQEAEPWIELRHSADPTGAGVLMWGAAEKSRFKNRMGIAEIAIQIVDLVKAEGKLTPTQVKAVQKGKYITTLRRFTNDPEVRSRLGLARDSAGALKFSSHRGKTMKALREIVTDLASGARSVKDVYHKGDRRNYLEDLDSAGLLPAPSPTRASATPAGAPTGVPARKGGVTGIPSTRLKLMPPNVTLHFRGERRIAKIFGELRFIKPGDAPNAVAVLFRVFLELSVDHYLLDNAAMTKTELDATRSLHKKIRMALDHMKKARKLDRNELRPLNRALQASKSIVGPASVESMHAYVHNPYFHPRPDDLKDSWDEWQRFLEEIWS